MSFVPSLARIVLILLVPAWIAGCSKLPGFEEAKKAVTDGAEQASQMVENTTESVKQSTGAAGVIELQLDAPVKSNGCYAALHVFSDGRPSVLQITSYKDPSGESFPSMIVRAETKAKAPADLNGQNLTAKAFVQESNNSDVWQSTEKPLELSISAADDSTITASFVGSLVNVVTGTTKETTGTINGSFSSK